MNNQNEVSSDTLFNPHVPGINYGILDTLVGYGVRRAQLALNDLFIQSLAPWNITPPRFSALVIISLNPGLKLTHLAKVLGIARSGAVMLVDALEDLGYVERQDVPEDRRAFGLALTAKGQTDLVSITQAVVDQDQLAARALGAEGPERLLAMLQLLANPSR
ncbi:MarR family winged helix-turn-helix transcriptional regulator [Aquabacterium sp.]|uniref:MarR family winged helix-turn-helix transcriptional regulator n=1 Tax=Aquabacterium sp. TaxID=1872578 RepID=UPI003D6C8DE4